MAGMSGNRYLIFLVQGPEPRAQWSYTLLDWREVYDRNGQPHTGESGRLRDDMEFIARKWFKILHPGVDVVSEEWRDVPATEEEWKGLIDV